MSSDPDLENQEKQADNYSYISKSLAEVLSSSDDDIKIKKESENISCSFVLNDVTLSNLSLVSLSLFFMYFSTKEVCFLAVSTDTNFFGL